jgi:hypothetical protein
VEGKYSGQIRTELGFVQTIAGKNAAFLKKTSFGRMSSAVKLGKSVLRSKRL